MSALCHTFLGHVGNSMGKREIILRQAYLKKCDRFRLEMYRARAPLTQYYTTSLKVNKLRPCDIGKL